MPTLGNVIYRTLSSRAKVEHLQQMIRDAEWKAISEFIPERSRFLDVGCGAGYAMQRARTDKQCQVTGIDPDPGAHGVGRFEKDRIETNLTILQGKSEALPFNDESFDVVYMSHVLEHVDDEQKTLQEMLRVVKSSGVIIIGVPTAQMSLLNWISQVVFTTHIKLYENIRFIHRPGHLKRFISIFRIGSHSYPKAKSIWYDIFHYRTSNWQRIIERELKIQSMHFPLWYPYPDYPQWFKPVKKQTYSSSVFFICKK
jgi:ubiquinone/menaquinone biosynthesis C-methylase UbiE